MKHERRLRLPDGAAVTAGLLILLVFGVMAALGWGGTFSERENRNLAPVPDTPDPVNWNTDKQVESYLTDHIPFRQVLVAADSAGLYLTGRNSQLNTWLAGGALVERPVQTDELSLRDTERRLGRLGSFAEKAGVPWYILTPPTHGSLTTARMSPLMAAQYAQEADIHALVDATGHRVDMPESFAADPDTMYYRTDHHWTLAGAYQAYVALGDALGYAPLPLNGFRITEYAGFRGTTLSRSGLPSLWSDTLVCAEPDSPVTLTVTDGDSTVTWDHLIFPEDAATYDGYAVYLHGNHGLLIIERPDAPEGTLVVFRDSFASCLLPMLSQHYRRVIAVDARYYTGVFSDALAVSDDTAAILYVYSLDSLVNGSYITRKAR